MVNSMKVLNKYMIVCSALFLSQMAFAQDDDLNVMKVVDANGFIDTVEAHKMNQKMSSKRLEEESLKIDLSIATMKSEIKKLASEDGGENNEKSGSSNGSDGDKVSKEIESLRSQIASLSANKSAGQQSSKSTELQVTKIVGVGSDLYATIYYKGSFYKKRTGDQIASGVVVKSISAESVGVLINGRIRQYFVTSLELPKSPVGEISDAIPISGSAIPIFNK